MTNERAGNPAAVAVECDADEEALTPEEIRRTLIKLSRRQIDEQGARPAIEAYTRIMRQAASSSAPTTAAEASSPPPCAPATADRKSAS
ncbi:MAG: hypothetical protein ACRD9R_18585 [Pyrinomonadaceae bacterium]